MQWEKLGRIFEPRGDRAWMRTHAANPMPRRQGGDRYRIYCTGRDDAGRGQIGWIEIDLKRPAETLAISEQPTIASGPLGAFDDSGVLNASILEVGAREFHYFYGMTLGVTVPFYFYVSVGLSSDGGDTVQKVSASPILERDAVDPYATGSPWVMRENGVFRMWYTSGVRWALEAGLPKHYYHIKYAESDDGIRWRREGIVAIDLVGDEHVTAKPCVVRDGELYRMWYSRRCPAYRLGYAESRDGVQWHRRDDLVGLTVSDDGWDSEMVEYCTVFDHEGERLMLYNGNAYGRTGIGLARLVR
jgi:hypothetical protein